MGPRSARHLILPLLLALFAYSPTVGACLCGEAKGQILLPTSSKLAPAAGPWLVLRPPGETPTLRTELGEPVIVVPVQSYSGLSMCARNIDLFGPKVPLEDGAFYQLSISWDGGYHTRRFRATTREPNRIERALGVSLERVIDDSVVSGAMCGPAKLDGLHTKGYFHARIETDAPALLFLELSAADTTFDRLVEGNATLGSGLGASFAVSSQSDAYVPELDTTAACAKVTVRDARNDVLYDEELCPAPGARLTADLKVSVPEHLVREDPESASDAEGCGCRARPKGSPLWSVLAPILVAILARRRGERR